MRQTSVMISVEDSLYDEVVEPMKRNKSFAKLVVALLNGYTTDPYIRAYIDDTIEEVHRAVVGSFESSVNDMESVLAGMGLLTDELKAQSQAGYRKFQKHGEEQKNSVKDSPSEEIDSRDEVAAINQRVSELETAVSKGFESISQQLKDIFESGTMAQSCKPEPEKDSIEVSNVVEDLLKSSIQSILVEKEEYTATTVQEPSIPNFSVESEEDPSVDKSQANSFLASIVADFGSY